jgi:protein SYS1
MKFDPKLIVLQILTLQALYYLSLSTLLVIFHLILDASISMNQIFGSDELNFVSLVGAANVMSVLGAAVGGAFLLAKIVERSKKCVDFTFTLFFLHILLCCQYDGFPMRWEWWLAHAMASTGMATLGEYLCALREMEEIPLYSTQ